MVKTCIGRFSWRLERWKSECPIVKRWSTIFLVSSIFALRMFEPNSMGCARVSTVEAKIDRISFELQAVKSEVQALPRILADMLDERAKRGG